MTRFAHLTKPCGHPVAPLPDAIAFTDAHGGRHTYTDPVEASVFLGAARLDDITGAAIKTGRSWTAVDMTVAVAAGGKLNGRTYQGFTAQFHDGAGRHLADLGFGRYIDGKRTR